MSNSVIKNKLALAYQIASKLKLDDHTYTHISSRSNDGFYIYPFGLMFNEVKYNNLIEVTLDGEIIEGEEFQYNKTGYIIHGEIYKERNDINSIFHIHTPEIVAVASCIDGLLPISQWALHFYSCISYHDYDSLALNTTQGSNIVKDLNKNYVMLMRNHGSLTCGKTIEEAMFYTYHLQKACETQCLILNMNSKYVTPSATTCKKAVHDLISFEKNLGERDWHAWTRLLKQ